MGGGSWIASGPVIVGPISGEVGAAGAAAAAGATGPGGPGGRTPDAGATAGGGGASGAWASWSAHAQAEPTPSKAAARAAPEMLLFLMLFI